jgi:aspartate/tyrosine/aromatic aminotransferase
MDESKKTDDSLYFDIGKAWNEAKSDFSYGTKTDKAASSAKLVGKTLFNTGLYAGKLGIKFVKELPHQMEKMQMQREEMREKLESKTSPQLLSLIKGDGFFGPSTDEKTIAKKILRERGEG